MMKNEMIVYHGTDLPLGKRILRDGVKIPSVEKVRDDLLKKYKIKVSDVSEKVWTEGVYFREMKAEPLTDKEKAFYKKHKISPPDTRPFVSVTPEFYIAKRFAQHPFELRNLIEKNLLEYLGLLDDRAKYKFKANQPVVLTCILKNPKKHMGEHGYNWCKEMKKKGHECGYVDIKIHKGEEKDLKCYKITKVKRATHLKYSK